VQWIQENGNLWELGIFLHYIVKLSEDPTSIFPQQFIAFIYENHLDRFYAVKPLIDVLHCSLKYRAMKSANYSISNKGLNSSIY
jgi:hypothetical protein